MRTRSKYSFTYWLRNQLWLSLSSIVIIMTACSSDSIEIDSPDSGGTKDPLCPVAEAIDLGLPSGTKWASWNIGATKPEGNGGYYAWGETEEKKYYYWSTYIHCDGTEETCHLLGVDIAGSKYDVAHVKWGGSWRMPSKAQTDELIETCARKWTQLNGVYGVLVTGPNGNSIFLPAAGYRLGDHLYYEGDSGYYYSSSVYPGNESYVLDFGFYSRGWDCDHGGRHYGFSVRAFCP